MKTRRHNPGSLNRTMLSAGMCSLLLVMTGGARGGDIFVTNDDTSTIGQYTTSGITVNASLISGLSSPWAIAVTTSAVPEPSSFIMASVGLLAGLAHAWSRHRRDRRRRPMGPADPNRPSTSDASRDIFDDIPAHSRWSPR